MMSLAWAALYANKTWEAVTKSEEKTRRSFPPTVYIGDRVLIINSMHKSWEGQLGIVLDNEAGGNPSAKNILVALDGGVEAFLSLADVEVVTGGWSHI